MRLRSFSRLFRARPKDVKWSNIYSLGSHTATRNSAHCFSVFFVFFVFFFFFRKVLECDSMHFLHPSQVKTLSFAYSRGFKFQVFFWENAKKNRKNKKTKKTKRAPKGTYTIVSAICDCAPEVRRKREVCAPNSTDVLSFAFGLLVCVRGGGMRCCRLCALNQHIPNRIS